MSVKKCSINPGGQTEKEQMLVSLEFVLFSKNTSVINFNLEDQQSTFINKRSGHFHSSDSEFLVINLMAVNHQLNSNMLSAGCLHKMVIVLSKPEPTRIRPDVL